MIRLMEVNLIILLFSSLLKVKLVYDVDLIDVEWIAVLEARLRIRTEIYIRKLG